MRVGAVGDGGLRDGSGAGGGAEPPRATDHGRRLCPWRGDGGRRGGRVARPADEDGGPHPAGDPRAEGALDAPARRTDLRVPGEPPAGPRRADRAKAGAPDILRRLAREGGGRPSRRRGRRAGAGRAGPAGGPHRAGPAEGGMTMSGWIDPSPVPWGGEWLGAVGIACAAKSAAVLAVAAVAALALRRGSAAARHLVWTVAVAGSLSLPALSALLPGWWVSLTALRPAPPAPSAPARPRAPGTRPLEIAAIVQDNRWRPDDPVPGALPGNPPEPPAFPVPQASEVP